MQKRTVLKTKNKQKNLLKYNNRKWSKDLKGQDILKENIYIYEKNV